MRGFFHDVSAWLQKHFMAIEVATWAFALVALTFSGFQYYSLSQQYYAAKAELSSSTAAYAKTTTKWRDRLEQAMGQNQLLAKNLTDAENQNAFFQAQINGVKGQVDHLTILSKVDKELLEKYSRVYFLSENYAPATTTPIEKKYTLEQNRSQIFLTNAYPYLSHMIDDAASSSVNLKIVSAYRSFDAQTLLKADYKMTFGSGANAFSADQGYSEHQLGTTADFTTAKVGSSFASGFENSDGYAWLQENAYKYGFVLSYPKGNTYYVYEPWHWRFVGVALATRLHNDDKYFYDLDQREIDGYLSLMFN